MTTRYQPSQASHVCMHTGMFVPLNKADATSWSWWVNWFNWVRFVADAAASAETFTSTVCLINGMCWHAPPVMTTNGVLGSGAVSASA